MKAITTLLTTSLFAVSAYAGNSGIDIYHGFAGDNTDMYQWQGSASEAMTGIQPAIGDAPYSLSGGHDTGLFESAPVGDSTATRVDAYGGFAGPDLPSSF